MVWWKYYLVYVAWLAFECVFVFLFIIETKNKTLEETAALFDGDDSLASIAKRAEERAYTEERGSSVCMPFGEKLSTSTTSKTVNSEEILDRGADVRSEKPDPLPYWMACLSPTCHKYPAEQIMGLRRLQRLRKIRHAVTMYVCCDDDEHGTGLINNGSDAEDSDPNPIMPIPLHLAVCLFPAVTALDYQGPMELLGFLAPENPELTRKPAHSIIADYLSHTMDPVAPISGPRVMPTGTYDGVEMQYDIILLPGGAYARPSAVPELVEFIKRQAPTLKFILSVCTGSWILSGTGVLDGKKATSNKSVFKNLQEATKDLPITWVPKARWVVDDDARLWTSSGVTAGQDMASAFLEHLIGKEDAEVIRNIVELSVKEAGDDEFAEHYGLVTSASKS
ncbi:hypothetical protein HWV62_36947 [Athelia sp. TMB]|nr:hypothetical protein HWV62_36947 [Athelia sp. TMB]